MIIPYKMTCFHPCYILPWYVTVSIPAFFLPSFFAFGRKRQETWNISPFFFIFDKACEDKSERGGVPFFSNRQPTKCNSSSALERSPFPQRPQKQRHLLCDSWDECFEGTSRAYTVLHTQAAASCSQHLIFLLYKNLPDFLFSFVVIMC